MIKLSRQVELITPCFCAGADSAGQAEVRAPSIRGQLRWWFRTLGGLKSLGNLGLGMREQEALIFGSAAGDSGVAGKLLVRVSGRHPSTKTVGAQEMNASPGTTLGYLLFPLRGKRRGVYNPAAEGKNPPSFRLDLFWGGDRALKSDLMALFQVFVELGSLGFRSRRAMGALASATPFDRPVSDALHCFSHPESIFVFSLPADDANHAIAMLAAWLISWRAHGRSGKNGDEQKSLGFVYAKSDHDAYQHDGPGFRAALGLPILAKYGNWNYEKPAGGKSTSGRFASPVMLRPHRRNNGSWLALVIFVDLLKWENDRKVFFDGRPRGVSLDLYNAMVADSRLSQLFPVIDQSD